MFFRNGARNSSGCKSNWIFLLMSLLQVISSTQLILVSQLFLLLRKSCTCPFFFSLSNDCHCIRDKYVYQSSGMAPYFCYLKHGRRGYFWSGIYGLDHVDGRRNGGDHLHPRACRLDHPSPSLQFDVFKKETNIWRKINGFK